MSPYISVKEVRATVFPAILPVELEWLHGEPNQILNP